MPWRRAKRERAEHAAARKMFFRKKFNSDGFRGGDLRFLRIRLVGTAVTILGGGVLLALMLALSPNYDLLGALDSLFDK